MNINNIPIVVSELVPPNEVWAINSQAINAQATNTEWAATSTATATTATDTQLSVDALQAAIDDFHSPSPAYFLPSHIRLVNTSPEAIRAGQMVQLDTGVGAVTFTYVPTAQAILANITADDQPKQKASRKELRALDQELQTIISLMWEFEEDDETVKSDENGNCVPSTNVRVLDRTLWCVKCKKKMSANLNPIRAWMNGKKVTICLNCNLECPTPETPTGIEYITPDGMYHFLSDEYIKELGVTRIGLDEDSSFRCKLVSGNDEPRLVRPTDFFGFKDECAGAGEGRRRVFE